VGEERDKRGGGVGLFAAAAICWGFRGEGGRRDGGRAGEDYCGVEWRGVAWRGSRAECSVVIPARKKLTGVKSMFFICQYNIYNFKFEHLNNLF
jgi:hypothetical protein